ncbi:MAG: transporter [Acidobacteria bacterium RIFCSPLOWO2_12_FULL_60_22]|nr:MAG: transporter [Acidobacteria bacterium RIFCSPLOWO2_12_FULL_60_22]
MAQTKVAWLVIGLGLLLLISFMDPRPGLTTAGQRVLGVLVFAVIMWISEAVPYVYTAFLSVLFLTIFLGFSPAEGTAGPLLGTSKALQVAVSGFVSGGTILVTAALFLTAAIEITGLEKRIAFGILKVLGPKTHRVFAGIVLVMLVLAFLIPSIIARAAVVTPLAVSLITAFGVDRKSIFARNLLICVGLSASISGIGVLSAGIPNPIATSFIERYLHHTITWMDWLRYSLPYSIALMLALYFLLTRLNKFEFNEIPGGRQVINEAYSALGPMSAREKRILFIFILTIVLWATEAYHKTDVNTVAILAVTLVLTPYIGIANWKELSNRANIGSIVLIASAAVSLGQALLDTGAATWLTKSSLGGLGIQHMPSSVMMAVLVIALILIRHAFASITSATATLIPTVLALLLSFGNPALPMWGMALIATFTLYFSFILPVSAPHIMITFGTDTFEVRDLMKIGIPLSLIALILLVVFWYTYWKWLGIVY